MTNDSEWTDWIPHVAGDPCPIQDAKAGEYDIKIETGTTGAGSQLDAIGWSKGVNDWWKTTGTPTSITHYRLRKPSPDWKGIAEKRGDALDTILDLLGNIDHSKGSGANYATDRGGMLESIREIATEGKSEAIK